jgi:LysM repeat protein
MKIGSAVLGVHIAVLCAFALTQGCVTTESQNPTAGAQQKGPFRHIHKGKTADDAMMNSAMDQQMGYGDDLGGTPLYGVEPIDVSPMPVAVQPVASSTATDTYIVRKGDTLSQLAVDFDTTTAELVRINGLANPDVLYVGQELRVPAGRRGTKSTSTRTSAPAVKKGGTYTIQKGDTLSEIALAAGVSIDALRQLNNIQGDMIRAGDTIDIPAGGKVPATTKKAEPAKTAPKAEPKVDAAPAATTLAVPEMAPAVEEPAEVTETVSIGVIEERVVYPGETLDAIAREYGVSKDEIMRLNGIADETQVKDGQRLRIPIAE